jgi:hypothetical protein
MSILPTISSVGDFFSTAQLVLISSAAAFGAGVYFSQRVKDWLAGVPSDLRAALKGVEADVQAKVKAAQADVVGKVIAAVSPQEDPALARSARGPGSHREGLGPCSRLRPLLRPLLRPTLRRLRRS